MAHKCIKCGKIYKNSNEDILKKGCLVCGGTIFLYISEKEIEEREDKKEKLLSLPIENIRLLDKGKYLIDINKIFRDKIVIIRNKEGKYNIKF